MDEIIVPLQMDFASGINFKMKTIVLIVIIGIFIASFISLVNPASINSTNYSGFDASGNSGGNITSDSFSGDSASFYQQSIGYLNSLLYSGINSFSFNVSAPTGYLPALTLSRPENKTYIRNTDIKLNFTYSNANYIWYNLDNGSNTTLSNNVTFNTTSGPHTLYLYANNSYGNSSKNITFTANATKIVIKYNNHSGSKKGESTNFNESSYEDLQNLSDIILEHTDYGKIRFNSEINLSNDNTPDNNEIDLDDYIMVSNNSIIINSTALPNFNKSATLYLYNLAFINPKIMKDGENCPSTICNLINYSGGTFVFNVSHFTSYSLQETPDEDTHAASPSGGGGGTITATSAFALDKGQIFATLSPGEVKTEEFVITNTGGKVASFRIDNLFTDFIARGEDVVVLNPGESKAISIYILARIDTAPDLYIGKLVVSSGGIKKEVLIAIEVESKGILLDVRTEILAEHKTMLAEEDVLAEMRLFNLGGDLGRKDVLIEYIIKDYEGNEIIKESESLAIETQVTFIKRINLLNNAKEGRYILYVRAIYEDKIASSSDNFEIVSSKTTEREKLYIVIIIILSIIISLIIYLGITHHKKRHGERGKNRAEKEGGKEFFQLIKR